MAGQQRQQIASLLDFDLVHLVRLDDLNVGHGIGQRLPQVGELHGVTYLQTVDMPEVVRAAPTSVSGDDLDRTLVCGVAVPLLACRTERR